MRFSKSAMYHKRGIWKAKAAGAGKKAKPAAARPSNVVEKTVKGDKNGGTRKVLKQKAPKFYPTEDLRGRRNQKKSHKVDNREKKPTRHSKKLRSSITPGTVLILLAGKHKGKHVVFLKQLESGLLLITGPWKINGAPLRRVNQRLVIATKTKLDISKVNVDASINDAYFRRIKAKSSKDAGIFDQKKEEYKPSEQRVKDQVAVDQQLLTAIKAHPDGKAFRGYLSSLFQLKNKQYPHEMVF
ncbi:60S ribosomal protein L6 [Hypsibius exemplaris]|uniref:Large ribosomal subunit protein eL6 n=1 Tax=Hypsibius exemplaris TaxID=2072580 RepID=A0A1W0XCA1_HYPEX|nr:60S ribosomal protein L6 [Hypsibius exemplaris]